MNLGVGSPSDSRRVSTPRHSSLLGDKRYNDNGTPYWLCKVYNGTGSALVANRPYMLTFAGSSTSAENPRVTALAASGAPQQCVIAHEAIPDASWGMVCYQGYHDCGIDGTTDVAAGDYLLINSGVSTTGLVKDGTSRSTASVAIAMEAQAANSTVDKRVYLTGDTAQSAGAVSFGAATFSGTVTIGDSTINAPSGGGTQWIFTPGAGSNGNVLFALGAGTLLGPSTTLQGQLGGSSNRWLGIFSSAGNFTGDITLAAGSDFILDAAGAGTKIGTATTQKLGFYNATPIVQPSAYTQTFATADKTHAARTATAVTNAFGTANGTFEDTSGTSAAIANNFAECSTSINALIADLADTAQLVNSLVDDLQALGLVA